MLLFSRAFQKVRFHKPFSHSVEKKPFKTKAFVDTIENVLTLEVFDLESKLANLTSTGPEKFVELFTGQIIEVAFKKQAQITRVAIERLSLFTEERCQFCLL